MDINFNAVHQFNDNFIFGQTSHIPTTNDSKLYRDAKFALTTKNKLTYNQSAHLDNGNAMYNSGYYFLGKDNQIKKADPRDVNHLYSASSEVNKLGKMIYQRQIDAIGNSQVKENLKDSS